MNHKDATPDFIREALEGLEPDRAGVEDALVALAVSTGVESPSPALKNRLLASATKGPMRFAPFFDELGRLFDLGVDAVTRVLERSGLGSSGDEQWRRLFVRFFLVAAAIHFLAALCSEGFYHADEHFQSG